LFPLLVKLLDLEIHHRQELKYKYLTKFLIGHNLVSLFQECLIQKSLNQVKLLRQELLD